MWNRVCTGIPALPWMANLQGTCRNVAMKTIWKSTLREIKESFGRFIAILAIVALGVGFFAGLKVTRAAMVETTGNYLEEQEIADLKEPDSYLLGRDTNVGYACFENDSAIVEGIANIFPVFFFLVAALGYSEGVIMSKYMSYSGSAAVIGCIIGYAGGTWLFPRVIWTAYGIMYRADTLVYVFDWKLAVISLAVSVLCSVGTTWLSCRVELKKFAPLFLITVDGSVIPIEPPPQDRPSGSIQELL